MTKPYFLARLMLWNDVTTMSQHREMETVFESKYLWGY